MNPLSLLTAGRPRKNRPPGLIIQWTWWTALMSPFGSNGSPYLPKPECSIDEKLAALSNSSILFDLN